jgi:hypothetical protein
MAGWATALLAVPATAAVQERLSSIQAAKRPFAPLASRSARPSQMRAPAGSPYSAVTLRARPCSSGRNGDRPRRAQWSNSSRVWFLRPSMRALLVARETIRNRPWWNPGVFARGARPRT